MLWTEYIIMEKNWQVQQHVSGSYNLYFQTPLNCNDEF